MRQLAAHARDVAQPGKHTKKGGKGGKSNNLRDLNDISAPWVVKDIENGNKSASPDQPGVYPGDREATTDAQTNAELIPAPTRAVTTTPARKARTRERLRKMQSQRIADKFTTEGELGSRSKPITDPKDLMGVDLLHSRIGGERYAKRHHRRLHASSPTDRDHPLWRINGGPSTRFDASGRTNLAGAGALGAGVLGAGALGAAALEHAVGRAWVPVHWARWVAAARAALSLRSWRPGHRRPWSLRSWRAGHRRPRRPTRRLSLR